MKLSKLELKRLSVFNRMTESTKKVAKELDAMFGREARDQLLLRYDLGVAATKVMADPAANGADAIDRLARSLGLETGELRELAQWPAAFARARVEQFAEARLASGACFTVAHLLALARVPDAHRREKLVHKVFEEGLTPRQLRRLLADGSARPADAERRGRAGRTGNADGLNAKGEHDLSQSRSERHEA